VCTGRLNHKIGSEEITRLRYEKGSIKYEDEVTTDIGLADLDEDLLAQYMRDTSSEQQDKWQFLKDNGLATCLNSKWRLHKSGALLFARNPTTTLKSKCGVKSPIIMAKIGITVASRTLLLAPLL
jgi:predicted HTH transcriptional regulator